MPDEDTIAELADKNDVESPVDPPGTVFVPGGAAIVLLLWLYVSANAFLFGAELNAELERSEKAVKPARSPKAVARALRGSTVPDYLAIGKHSITGKDEDFARKEKAQNRLDEALADKKVFAEIRERDVERMAPAVLAGRGR